MTLLQQEYPRSLPRSSGDNDQGRVALYCVLCAAVGALPATGNHRCAYSVCSSPCYGVQTMTESAFDDTAHLEELIGTLRQRLWVLELQIAHYGQASAPVHLL